MWGACAPHITVRSPTARLQVTLASVDIPCMKGFASRTVAAAFAVALVAAGCASDTSWYEYRIASLESELAEVEAAQHSSLIPPDVEIAWCHGHVDDVLRAADALRVPNQPGNREFEWSYREVPGLTGGTLEVKDEVVEQPEWVEAWETWTTDHVDEWSRSCRAAFGSRWYFLTKLT